MTGATVPLDEAVHFDVVMHSPSTGGISDGDSAPTFDVFEEATDTPILDDQTMTKRTSLTGNYRGTFTASAANGFEVGKWYIVIATGTVGGVTGKVPALIFRLVPAETAAGVPKVDLTHVAGSTTDVSTMPASLASVLADTNELQTDWVNGGRLDLILDATATASALSSLVATVGAAGAGLTEAGGTGDHLTALATQASVDDLPTNAELAASQAAADDAMLAAIAALNNLSAAQVRTELATELGRIDAAVSTRATPAQILTTQLTEAYATDGAAPTLTQALMLIQQALTEVSISGTSMVIKKLDGSTTAATLTLNDSTTPTAKTRSG